MRCILNLPLLPCSPGQLLLLITCLLPAHYNKSYLLLWDSVCFLQWEVFMELFPLSSKSTFLPSNIPWQLGQLVEIWSKWNTNICCISVALVGLVWTAAAQRPVGNNDLIHVSCGLTVGTLGRWSWCWSSFFKD